MNHRIGGFELDDATWEIPGEVNHRIGGFEWTFSKPPSVSSVNHRIGGFEWRVHTRGTRLQVNHRIGGFESAQTLVLRTVGVNHRVGGFEYQMAGTLFDAWREPPHRWLLVTQRENAFPKKKPLKERLRTTTAINEESWALRGD